MLAQAVSLEMADRFKQNPKQVAQQFKQVLDKDCDITFEEALQMLDLPGIEKLIDGYVDRFSSRTRILDEDEKDL